MASRFNEEIMNSNLDLGDGEIKIEGKANPVYADAINVHNKKKKEIDKTLKDKKPELKKPFTGTKGTTTVMPKTPSMKKLKLSEDMFKNVREHMNDAPEAYEGIFRVIDNMEHIINYISELTDEELTYEDMKQSYDVLEDAMLEFKVYLDELKRPTKNEAVAVDVPTKKQKKWELQDKRNNKDIWSDIYNELVDMKSLETPHRRMGKQNRYKGSWDDANAIRVGASRDGEGIVVKAEEIADLDFAKEVAETYGVEWRIKEHTSRYADVKYELFIYPFRPVATVVEEGLKEETKSIKLSGVDKKALKYIQDYRANKFDLEDLHTYIEKLYGNKKSAVTRLAELDELSDSDIDKVLGAKESIKSKRTRK